VTNNKTAQLSNTTVINGNLTINTNTTLNLQSSNLLMQGNSGGSVGNVANNGTVTNTSATGANRFQFSGLYGAQTYSGSGVFGTVALAIAGINIVNPSGVTISSP